MCVNNDDDNENGVPDLQETGPDPDVLSLTVSAQGGLNGPVTLSATGGNPVKLYQDAGRTTVVTLPKTWDASELPKTLYVEGVQVSGGVRDVELQLEYTGPGGPCEDGVKLTVFCVHALQVDAVDPHAATISYHVAPPGLTLTTVTFTAPGTTQTQGAVTGDFSFAYDQDDLVSEENLIRLESTVGGVTCTTEVTATQTLTHAPPDDTVAEIAFFEICIQVDGLPVFITVPVLHSIWEQFAFICYSIDVVGGSKTLWVGKAAVNIRTESGEGVPTEIASWTETHLYRNTQGDHLEEYMNDVTGPTQPAQGPHFRSKVLWNDAFFAPQETLTGIAEIDSLMFRDNNDLILAAPIANTAIDLALEPNADPPTHCP